MERARQNIKEVLDQAKSAAVLSSFGKDSLLLLSLVREFDTHIPVLWFRRAVNAAQVKFARTVIRAWDLEVYSYEPADVYLLAQNGDRSLIQEYSFGTDRLPVVVDLAEDGPCSLEPPEYGRTPLLNLPFDALLVGYKDSDTHWLKGDAKLFGDDYRLGGAKVTAPIRHLSDDTVRAAMHQLPFKYGELDDRIALCTACMTSDTDEVWCPRAQDYIPREPWDSEGALTAFQQRFGLSGGTNHERT